MEVYVLRRFGDNRRICDDEGSKWSSLELAQLVALYTQQELDISTGAVNMLPGRRAQLTWMTDGFDRWRAYASRSVSSVMGFTIERCVEHDIHALQVLLPSWWELLGDLAEHPGDPDTNPDRLSYPYAYKTAFEMELDGTCWFRVWDRTGGLSVDDETGVIIDPGLPPEEAAATLHSQMLAFMRGKFPEE